MRTGRRRLATAAACIPLALLALSACGPEENSGSGDNAPSASASPSDEDAAKGKNGEEGAEGTEGANSATDEPTEVSHDLPKDEKEPGNPGGPHGPPRVITYDASAASEFREAIDIGSGAWNQSVRNIELRPVKPGQKANVTINVADTWPEATIASPPYGSGVITIGRDAIDEGHPVNRIMAHEFGHILGLKDRRNKGCSSLMSGHAGGVTCENFLPDPYETRVVKEHFTQ